MPTRRPRSRRPNRTSSKAPSRSPSRSPSRASHASEEYYDEEEPRTRRVPQKSEDNTFAYVGIGLAAILILTIAFFVFEGAGEDYTEKLKKTTKKKEEKEKKGIALFSLTDGKKKKKNSGSVLDEPENTEEKSSSLFADKEMEKKRLAEEKEKKDKEDAIRAAEEAKMKAMEEAKKKGELPEYFDFLPDTSIGDKAKIKGLCKKLVSDNYQESDKARADLIKIGKKATPMLLNALKELDVTQDEGGILGNIVAQTLQEVTGQNHGYEGFGSPSARDGAKKKWLDWWNKERIKYEK